MFFLIKSVCYLSVLLDEGRPISGAWVAGKPLAALNTVPAKSPMGPQLLTAPLSTLNHQGEALAEPSHTQP